MGCSAPGGCDVIQDGDHLGHHLEFYPKFEIIRLLKLKIYDATSCAF